MKTKVFIITIIASVLICSGSGCSVSKKSFQSYQTDVSYSLSQINQKIDYLTKQQSDLINSVNVIKNKQVEIEEKNQKSTKELNNKISQTTEKISKLERDNNLIIEQINALKVNQKSESNDSVGNLIYEKIIALKEQYPEGMPWTNKNYYKWNGGIYNGGYGCYGFAFILSDAAFDKLPARRHHDFNNIKIGDILRMDGDSHSVVIIEINDTMVTFAEGNFNSSIHWGRKITIEEMKKTSNYVLTRYPE